MILGVEIENFDVFDKDLAGILIEEGVSIVKEKAFCLKTLFIESLFCAPS